MRRFLITILTSGNREFHYRQPLIDLHCRGFWLCFVASELAAPRCSRLTTTSDAVHESSKTLVLDVRSAEEFASGHLPSKNIPLTNSMID